MRQRQGDRPHRARTSSPTAATTASHGSQPAQTSPTTPTAATAWAANTAGTLSPGAASLPLSKRNRARMNSTAGTARATINPHSPSAGDHAQPSAIAIAATMAAKATGATSSACQWRPGRWS